jgi:PmbA protein
MEAILEKARKVAQEAEVFLVSSEETPVHFEANRLKQVQTKQSTGVALRIVKDGRVGFASSNDIDDAEGLVNMAAETAEFGSPARFEFPSPDHYPDVKVFDPATEKVTVKHMITLGEDLIAAVTAHTPEILCEAYVARGTYSMHIANSRGGEAQYRATTFSLGIEGTVIHGTDMLFVGDGQSSCHPILDGKEIAGMVKNQLELAKTTARVASKPMPVIFTPHGVADALIAPLMAAFNGKLVLQGASPLAGRLGEKLFDEKLSLSDDPTIAYRPQSHPCDDEGVPSQRLPLIDKGSAANFFYDLQTAAMAGTRSTGNASRQGGLPAPAPNAFIIAPGTITFDEMVADMKEGLVIEQLMGATQSNILGGDFSGNVLLGYKVEMGKIVGRVKDTMVSGNIYQVLSEINALSSEPRWVGSALNTPAIYCPRLSVATK